MNSVQQLLGLPTQPVAVGFLDTPPPGVPKWEGAVPAGCAFWKQAMSGKAFYTVAADHHNCAVGSHTHKIGLPADRAGELEGTIGFMVSNNYLRMEEVPGIPTLSRTPAVIAYGPAGSVPFAADVVVITANPAQAMLVYEASLRAGAGNALTSVLGRPGCASLPLALGSGVTSLSFGCKGNRTFTGLDDSQMYCVVPGKHYEAVARELAATIASNEAMGAYYEGRKSQFPILT
jgi:uncharacterized protein (DUF169 family)